jgi:hypothetical protein
MGVPQILQVVTIFSFETVPNFEEPTFELQ